MTVIPVRKATESLQLLLHALLFLAFVGCMFLGICFFLLRIGPSDHASSEPFAASSRLRDQDEKMLLPERTPHVIDFEILHEKNGTLDYLVAATSSKQEILTLAFSIKDQILDEHPKTSVLIRIHDSNRMVKKVVSGQLDRHCTLAEIQEFRRHHLASVYFVEDLDYCRVQWHEADASLQSVADL